MELSPYETTFKLHTLIIINPLNTVFHQVPLIMRNLVQLYLDEFELRPQVTTWILPPTGDMFKVQITNPPLQQGGVTAVMDVQVPLSLCLSVLPHLDWSLHQLPLPQWWSSLRLSDSPVLSQTAPGSPSHRPLPEVELKRHNSDDDLSHIT